MQRSATSGHADAAARFRLAIEVFETRDRWGNRAVQGLIGLFHHDAGGA
jgi:hypothetical protein